MNSVRLTLMCANANLICFDCDAFKRRRTLIDDRLTSINRIGSNPIDLLQSDNRPVVNSDYDSLLITNKVTGSNRASGPLIN